MSIRPRTLAAVLVAAGVALLPCALGLGGFNGVSLIGALCAILALVLFVVDDGTNETKRLSTISLTRSLTTPALGSGFSLSSPSDQVFSDIEDRESLTGDIRTNCGGLSTPAPDRLLRGRTQVESALNGWRAP